MEELPEPYYPGLDLVYDKEHRARFIERGDMDVEGPEVSQKMFSFFFATMK